MNHHTCKNGWHLCASHFCFAHASIPPHREAPLPGVRRQIFLPDAGDLDIVAFLDEGEQGHKFVRAALHFQRDAAVVLVLHPAGELQRLGRVAGAVRKEHGWLVPANAQKPIDRRHKQD